MKEFQVIITAKCTDKYISDDGNEFFDSIKSGELAGELMESIGMEEVTITVTEPREV